MMMQKGHAININYNPCKINKWNKIISKVPWLRDDNINI